MNNAHNLRSPDFEFHDHASFSFAPHEVARERMGVGHAVFFVGHDGFHNSNFIMFGNQSQELFDDWQTLHLIPDQIGVGVPLEV
jgi:hypothetical protein